jgi:hypothetical protein
MFAIGEYLSDWGNLKKADTILRHLEKGSSKVIVWEPFEHYPADQVVEFIGNLASNAQRLLDQRKELV